MDAEYVKTLGTIGGLIGNADGRWRSVVTEDLTISAEYMYDFITAGGVTAFDFHNTIMSGYVETLGEICDLVAEQNTSKTITSTIITIIQSKFVPYLEHLVESLQLHHIDIVSHGVSTTLLGISLAMETREKNYQDFFLQVTEACTQISDAPLNYLGGAGIALFMLLAKDKVDIARWGNMLLDFLSTREIRHRIADQPRETLRQYVEITNVLAKYLQDRFENNKPSTNRLFHNLSRRCWYALDNFSFTTSDVDPNITTLGSVGFSALLLAYDAVLSSNGVWERLVYYGIIAPGNRDVIGAISSILFGVYYGKETIPERNFTNVAEKLTTRPSIKT